MQDVLACAEEEMQADLRFVRGAATAVAIAAAAEPKPSSAVAVAAAAEPESSSAVAVAHASHILHCRRSVHCRRCLRSLAQLPLRIRQQPVVHDHAYEPGCWSALERDHLQHRERL